jgi:predicted nucleotidyltransferase
MKLVTMKFGSHLYGTNTPASDLDLKSVHLPPADAMLAAREAGR